MLFYFIFLTAFAAVCAEGGCQTTEQHATDKRGIRQEADGGHDRGGDPHHKGGGAEETV